MAIADQILAAVTMPPPARPASVGATSDADLIAYANTAGVTWDAVTVKYGPDGRDYIYRLIHPLSVAQAIAGLKIGVDQSSLAAVLAKLDDLAAHPVVVSDPALAAQVASLAKHLGVGTAQDSGRVGSRTYSDEELDEVVAKRLSEKKQTVLEVLEALRPELEGMRREIAGANHIKRTIGRQITRLTESVDESNRQLQAHIALAGHAGDSTKLHRLETEVEGLLELRDEFGIAGMTKAQRAAAPAMAKAFVEGERSVIFWEELGRRIRPVKALAWTFLVGLATTAAYLFAHFALHLKISGVPI